MKGDNHWIKVRLIGVKSNRSAIGAKVLVKYGGNIQALEVAQSSFLSVDDRRLHFGLGGVGAVGLGGPLAERTAAVVCKGCQQPVGHD